MLSGYTGRRDCGGDSRETGLLVLSRFKISLSAALSCTAASESPVREVRGQLSGDGGASPRGGGGARLFLFPFERFPVKQTGRNGISADAGGNSEP
ncbi:hypothetical protein AAFF_G00108540 [Aldrovandia affinis]|uniref:Uncharacterized protein n=1 Tax=Aldrovandia affinis TaxID=143900 RepID=A0AAD7WBB0_9TELE|nr:hypothetical protein AAFF_G00108540 [Aldrovandia affinis]